MQDTPILFRLSLLFGGLAMLAWAGIQLGILGHGDRRDPRKAHAHGEPLPLPAARYRKTGPDKDIPNYGPLPPFRLVDDAGRTLDRERLSGHVWVASFLFTRCAGTCPTTAQRTQVLQASLPEGAKLVTLSVDPEHDTPEVLAEYAREQGRQEGRWLFATGAYREVSRLAAKGFYLGGSGALFHSTRLALVDRRGDFRGFYESTDDAELARLVRDIALLQAAHPAPDSA